MLDQLHYLEAIAQQDKRIANAVAVARDKVQVARERTKRDPYRVALRDAGRRRANAATAHAKSQLLASQGSLVGKRKRQKGRSPRPASRKGHSSPRRTRSPPRTRASAASSRRRQGATDTTPSSQGLIWPVSGPVTSPFGYRWGRLHAGIDIGVPYGHADPRRGRRARSCSPAGPAATATTPASTTAAGWRPATRTSPRIAVSGGAAGVAGPGDRLRRQHGPQLRPPPALRGPHQREARGSSGLPLARWAARRSLPSRTFPRFDPGTRARATTVAVVPTTTAAYPGAAGFRSSPAGRRSGRAGRCSGRR